MKKTTLCVIFGGESTEYEVSLRSCYAVLENVDREKYDVVKLGITKKGQWYIFEGENKEILNDVWEMGNIIPVTFDISNGHLIALDKSIYVIDADVYFPVLHGGYGEDGRLQGLFDIMGVKYVGCGAYASHVCMDKCLAKDVARGAGVQVAKGGMISAKCKMQNAKLGIEKAKFGIENGKLECDERSKLQDGRACCHSQGDVNIVEGWLAATGLESENSEKICYPVFVKPAMSGSSVGVSRVDSCENLEVAISKARRLCEKVIIEEAIQGEEIEVAVIEGDKEIIVSDVGMIKYNGDFYDYNTKYKSEENQYIIPAPIPKKATQGVQKAANELFKELGCRGLARMDFFYTDKGEVVFNEVNTMPGFTEISMFPKLLINMGYSFSQIIDMLVQSAEKRANC